MKTSLNIIFERNFYKISNEYKKFAIQKDACRQCSLYSHYEQVVMSEGNAESPTFLFIGEGPGADEAIQNRPFIGLAGQRLREELRKHPDVFNKESVLISNILGCRPLNNQFPSNGSTVHNCADSWLRKEIKLLKPKVIILLGSKALEYSRERSISGKWQGKRGITANRGVWNFLPEYKAWSLATFHPSYVIRCQKMNEMHIVKQFEEDIQQIATRWDTFVYGDDSQVEKGSFQDAVNAALDMGLIKEK